MKTLENVAALLNVEDNWLVIMRDFYKDTFVQKHNLPSQVATSRMFNIWWGMQFEKQCQAWFDSINYDIDAGGFVFGYIILESGYDFRNALDAYLEKAEPAGWAYKSLINIIKKAQ